LTLTFCPYTSLFRSVYNLLLPESGLANWVVTALFVWTLWNDIFADFDQKKLLRSFAGLFAIAFVTKYLVLSNLAVKNDASWLQRDRKSTRLNSSHVK